MWSNLYSGSWEVGASEQRWWPLSLLIIWRSVDEAAISQQNTNSSQDSSTVDIWKLTYLRCTDLNDKLHYQNSWEGLGNAMLILNNSQLHKSVAFWCSLECNMLHPVFFRTGAFIMYMNTSVVTYTYWIPGCEHFC